MTAIDFGPVSIGTISDSEGDRDALGVVSLSGYTELVLGDGAVGRLDVLRTMPEGTIDHLVADSVDLMAADFSALAGLRGCTGFDFDDTPLSDHHLALFAGSPITFLTVAGTKVSDAGMATVASLTELTNLFVNRTSVTDTGMAELAGHKNLRELTAQLDGVTPVSARTLATLELERVGLSGMNDTVLQAVAKRSLHTANFNRSSISREGLEALASGSTIEQLILTLSSFASGSIAALQEARSLLNLGLRHTNTTDEDLKGLSQAPVLAGLDLAATQITDAGLSHLVGLQTLQGLDLSGTAVTDAGIARLVGLPLLSNLKVDDTAVTQAALDLLPHLPKVFDLG